MQVLFIWRDLEPESLPGMSSREGAETGVGTGQYKGPYNLFQEDDVGESEPGYEDREGLTLGVVIMHIIPKFNMWATLYDYTTNFMTSFGYF